MFLLYQLGKGDSCWGHGILPCLPNFVPAVILCLPSSVWGFVSISCPQASFSLSGNDVGTQFLFLCLLFLTIWGLSETARNPVQAMSLTLILFWASLMVTALNPVRQRWQMSQVPRKTVIKLKPKQDLMWALSINNLWKVKRCFC